MRKCDQQTDHPIWVKEVAADDYVVRFSDSYESAWSVSETSRAWSRLLDMSSCDAEDVAVSYSVSIDRLLDASRADTTRYHVTELAVTSADDVAPEVELSSEEEEEKREGEETQWAGVRPWTLLVALDVLLLVARLTVTYVNAVDVYRGGRRQSLTYHQPATAAVDHHIANGQLGSSTPPSSRLKFDDVDDAARRSVIT